MDASELDTSEFYPTGFGDGQFGEGGFGGDERPPSIYNTTVRNIIVTD